MQWIGILGLSLWGGVAHAQARVQEVEAAPLGFVHLPTVPGTVHELRLDGCTGRPVMHVFDLDRRRQIAMTDPDAPEEPLWIESDGALVAIVRGAAEGDEGRCDVSFDGQGLWTADFGFSVVAVDSHTYDIPNEIWTALQPRGATDTVLVGFLDWNLTEVTEVDDDGGVGLASLIDGNHAVTKSVFVGAYSQASAGGTRLYTNDAWQDEDGDGLGALLEAELGTCDGSRGGTPTYACAEVIDPADTDRDGLPDGIELLGLDDATFPQELPRWGATPLAKDVFVEVDHSDGRTSQAPFGYSAYLDIRDALLEGAPDSIRNPDGSDGVRIHVDSRGQGGPGGTLQGDWGGSGVVPDAMSYQDASMIHMAPIRRGIFRYAKAETGCGGQADGWRFGFSPDCSAGDPVANFVHELGHTLGLEHHGDPRAPGLNCSPVYPSVMNYAYGDATFALTGRWFSTGDQSSVVNPARTDDHTPGLVAGGGFLYERWGVAAAGDWVDWDRSDHFARVDGGIRAAPTLATEGCGALDRNSTEIMRHLSWIDANGYGLGLHTPKVVRADRQLWGFALDDDGVLMVRTASHLGQTNGGCWDDGLGRTCHSWSQPDRIWALGRMRAFDVEVVDWFGSVWVLLAWTDEDGRVSMASRTRSWIGEWSEWELFDVPEWHVEDAIELSVVGRTDHGHWVLGLFGTNGGDVGWMRHVFGTGDWTGVEPVWTFRFDGSDGPVENARWGPTVVRWPLQGVDAEPYEATACAVLTHEDRSSLYCLEPQGDVWVQTGEWEAELAGPPRIAYHVPRRADGAPAHDERLGQFWITGGVAAEGGARPDVFITNSVRDEPGFEAEVVYQAPLVDGWTLVAPGTGVDLYEDLGIGAMKGLWLRDHGDNGTKWHSGLFLMDLPLADGSVDIDLRDTDDFEVIEAYTCRNLLAATLTEPEVDARCGKP